MIDHTESGIEQSAKCDPLRGGCQNPHQMVQCDPRPQFQFSGAKYLRAHLFPRLHQTEVMLAAVCVTGPLAAFSMPTAHADAAGFGTTLCNTFSNGQVCGTGISGSPAGYDAAYKKTGGSPVRVRFWLNCKNGFVRSDNGAFTITKGQRRSYVFSVGNQGECRIRLQDLSHGSSFYSPYVRP
ncbi:hypothetical protein Sru01_64250 [Sphaerisporangium rufum]|uniref:Uncharacterized protein n=1 Tax=Sphaerisporangium rufum TaxID=1381558 RepID=A0A919R916_9ACTN|nr:hypothetical protein [Sphaerisporangium rufum]GII81443.1 hypothetical protein Sru01_64250 [Sphaerisporangium rufum]